MNGRSPLLAATFTCALTFLAALPAAATSRDFPRAFEWGTAISGFQSEMGRGQDLDKRSDWWAWTHNRANIKDGTVTADLPERGPGFLARYRQDVDLAARALHARAFRLGIEWSRVFPRSTQGARTLKQMDRLAGHAELRRYRAILRRIRSRGMRPYVTLTHFTLPRWIHDPIAAREAFAKTDAGDPPPRGFGPAGWLDRSTVTEFRKYAGYLAWKLGPQVDRWITLNEPTVLAVNGYANIAGVAEGNFPPGALNFAALVQVIERQADANAAAYREIKRRDRGARVGFVHNMIAFTPASASAKDREGTRHADYLFNRLFLDAALKGHRDRNANGKLEARERSRRRGGKADFVGIDYYFRGRVTGLGSPLTPRIPFLDFAPATSYRSVVNPSGPPCPTTCSDFGNEIYPQGLRQVLRTAGRYRLPIVVTENGVADADDDLRPGHLRAHLRQLRATMRAREADVRGYFHWSLVDNFEWAAGYTQRFGLFRYDQRTLRRTARPSARLYGRIARTGNLP